jgi:hypothetical protein
MHLGDKRNQLFLRSALVGKAECCGPAEFTALLLSENPTANEQLLRTLRRGDINWKGVLAYAAQTGVITALRHELTTKQLWERVPVDIQQYLSAIADQNRHRNGKILTEAVALSALLNRAGFNPVFLKGVASLASGSYKDHAIRFILDIDLIVPKRQLTAVVHTLFDFGYTLFDQDLDRNALFARHYHALISPNKFVTVEIHRCLGPISPLLRPNDVLEGAILSHVQGASILIPNPVHAIAHHILHAQEVWRERVWPQPRHLYDLRLIVAAHGHNLDWPSILQHVLYSGNDRELRLLSNAAIGFLHAAGIADNLSYLGTPWRPNRRLRLLRKCPYLRYIDPYYMNTMFLSARLKRAVMYLRTVSGMKILVKRIGTVSFWSSVVSQLKSI